MRRGGTDGETLRVATPRTRRRAASSKAPDVTACWIQDLSDGELEARLRQVGVIEDRASKLVEVRDNDTVHRFIHDLLESGQ